MFMKIVLVGYMGSGKSTLGPLLADSLGLSFIDLDHYIETQIGLSIPEIFEQKGAVFFRKQERLALETLLLSKDHFVLATGGGAPCYGDNITFMKSHSDQIIYVKLSVATLLARLRPSKQHRPLIAHLEGDALEEFLRKHLFERAFYYNQSHLVVDMEDKDPSQSVAAILDQLKN